MGRAAHPLQHCRRSATAGPAVNVLRSTVGLGIDSGQSRLCLNAAQESKQAARQLTQKQVDLRGGNLHEENSCNDERKKQKEIRQEK